MRTALLLAAFVFAALSASAADLTVKEAIQKLQAQKQFLIDNHIANMQKRGETDADVRSALATGELQARSKVFIGQMHDAVIARLKALDKPGATVSSTEVDNYVTAFRGQLFALRDAMTKQAHEQMHDPTPTQSLDWNTILTNSRPDRQKVVNEYKDKTRKELGPVGYTNQVIETLSPEGAKTPPVTRGGGQTGTVPAGGNTGTIPDAGNGGTANAPAPTDQGPSPATPGGAQPGITPQSPEQSAIDRLALGDMRGAKSDLDAAAKSGTAGPDAYALRGEIAMNEGRFAQAVQDASSALQLDPKNPNALAVLHNSEGRADGAAPSQADAAAGNGQAPAFAGGFKGGSAYGGGPSGGAMESASASVSAAAAAAAANATPESPALARLSAGQARTQAEAALGMNDLGAARAYVDHALAQEPNNPALLNLRAQIEARGGNYAQAKADAMAGLALSPGDPGLRRTLGFAQVRGKDYRGAIATANGMMERDPDNAYAYALRAHAYGSIGDRDAMMSDLKRAAELDPAFRGAAAKMEGQLELPKDSDVLFLFPGEQASAAVASPSPAGPGSRRGLLLGAGAAGGLLVAGGLLLARKRPEPEPENEAENDEEAPVG